MENYSERIVWVTGSSRGIGRAIALAFAARGASVVLNHTKNGKDIDETVALMEATGAPYMVAKGNVSAVKEAATIAADIIKRFGKIDVLVNNAGITRDRPLMMLGEGDWDAVLDANLRSVYACSKAVIKPMMAQRYGRIVNISSVSGIAGREGQTNYAAAKAGMIGFTKSLAREGARYNVLVNAVVAGLIDTMMTKRMPRDIKEEILGLTPMGIIGSPDDIAGACLFFASSYATYVTGSALNVNGGGYM